jgi:hypothetical protein
LNNNTQHPASPYLESLCREVYGAYQFLSANDLSAVSGTSKRLRSGNSDKLRIRLAEELMELHGVIEGTHFHEGYDQDIILEGYEVIYWAFCLATTANTPYDQISPHLHLQKGFVQPLPKTSLLEALETSTKLITDWAFLPTVFSLVGSACATNGTDPARLLERDREEMRQKDYLTIYWTSLTTK